jgi:hypothetical protein
MHLHIQMVYNQKLHMSIRQLVQSIYDVNMQYCDSAICAMHAHAHNNSFRTLTTKSDKRLNE